MKIKKEKNVGEDLTELNFINKNTYDLLFEDKANLSEEEKLAEDQKIAVIEMEYYTQNKLYRLKYKLIKLGLKILFALKFYNIQYDKTCNLYNYLLPDETLEFDILSKHTTKPFKKFLESDERYGTCHSLSIALAKNFTAAKVVTGYISGRCDIRILHTIVELTDENGFTLYVDGTKNIVMPKSDCISLLNFVELAKFDIETFNPEILEAIPNCIKAYVLFQEEMERDFAKVKNSLKK